MHIKLFSIASFLLIWFAIVGVFNTLPLGFGFAVAVLTFLLGVKFDLIAKKNVFSLRLIPYIFWLLREIVLSAINVVKISWRPGSLKIIPTIEVIKSLQTSDEGVALYANSITLTPGTVTLNIEGTVLLVHALDVSIMEDLKEGEMDRRVVGVFKNTR